MKQTIKVPVADIRSFKKNSSHIKRNKILPILDYIKFDDGLITKTNINEFVVQESQFNGSFLIEERVLFNFIEYTTSDYVSFLIDVNKITISDGLQKTTSKQDDILLFPTTEQPPQESISLTDTILKYLGIAAKYTRDDTVDFLVSHVFVGGNSITASDRFIAYCRKIDRELPQLAIPRNVAEKVSGIDPADFSQTDNKLFFKAGKTLYGFKKTEALYMDQVRFFNYEKVTSFFIPKSELIGFNEMCLSMSPINICHPTLSEKNDKLLMSAIDGDFAVDNEKEVDILVKMENKFKYDASHMIRLLRTAPDEELTFTRSQGMMYIAGDSGFTSLIMELL